MEVRIGRIRLNRTTGYTGHQVGLKETPPVGKPGADVVYKGYDYLVPWTIDLKRGADRTAGVRGAADAGVHRCCAGGGLLSAIGAGRILGGNLDYNLIREGATVCCCRYFIRAVCCSLAMDMRCNAPSSRGAAA